MKFSVGYQMPDDSPLGFMEAVEEWKGHVSEVFFPFRSRRAKILN